MIRGRLRVLDSERMDRLDSGRLGILEGTGLQIQGQFLLRALAEAGCKVDFAATALGSAALVERQVAAHAGGARWFARRCGIPFAASCPTIARPCRSS